VGWVQSCILRKQAQKLVKKHPKTDTIVWGFAFLERSKNRQNRHKKGLFWDLGAIVYPSQISTNFGQNVTNVTPPPLFLRVGCNRVSFANKHKNWSKNTPKRIQSFGVLLFWSVPKSDKSDTKRSFLRVGCNRVSFAKAQKLVKMQQMQHPQRFFCGLAAIVYPSQISTKFGQSCKFGTHTTIF
jgi:hypothetical protein